MDGIVLIAALSALVLLCTAAKKNDPDIAGMNDTPVSIYDIRRGVQNGWYTCTLTRVDGIPAVRLSGKTTNGDIYTDVYRISEADWQTLQSEGYKVA